MKLFALALLFLPTLALAEVHCVDQTNTVRVHLLGDTEDTAIVDTHDTHLEFEGIVRGGRINFGIITKTFRKLPDFSLVSVTDMNTDGQESWTLDVAGIFDRLRVNCTRI